MKPNRARRILRRTDSLVRELVILVSRAADLVVHAPLVVLLTTIPLSAQTVAPAAAAPAPPTNSAAATNNVPAPARGGGRGGQGGPGRDDPVNAGVDYSKKPPVLPLSPAEQLSKFILQPGYRLELVLSDPLIQEPTAVAFDGNGRMFVLEDRGYMLDLDMTGQLDPTGRISMHVDANGDGIYEKHTVFADHLVFPRFVTPLGPNVILTKESNADELWKLTDTDGDGVADKKEFVDTGYGRVANIEGQEAFLTWAMDNWMYSTYNAFRARWTPAGLIKETTGNNGGEWGVTQDNDGKIWFESGAPGVPSGFQFPIVYGNFTVTNQFEPDFRIPWGAPIRIADMQGGMITVRMPDGSLNGVTGSAGNDIYRGHRLPSDLVGEYLYGEPIARIIRRIHPENQEGLTILHNAYPGNEFIKSLDPLFRPVDVTTAPDGTVYITDMYHGIIQVGNFTGPGTYLRAKIQQYDLDKVIHHGRIWRLVYDGVGPEKLGAIQRDKTLPRMNDESAAELVTHLNHPNGWWRDTAQRLLVLKQDKSVVPALQRIVRSSTNLLERFHAFWTLEGLGALDPALAREQMRDPEPRMRIQAIRASETLYKAGNRSFTNDYAAMTKDPNTDVVIQSLLTLGRWNVTNAPVTIKETMDGNPARGVQVVASTFLNAGGGRRGGRGGGVALTADQQNFLDRGAAIYGGLCATCHGLDGMGTPKPELNTTMAPPLAGSPRVNGHKEYIIKAVLYGLTGPVDDKTYTDLMIPMGANNDDWIASVVSYVRRTFGNSAGLISAADVAWVRSSTAGRNKPWPISELTASLPVVLPNDGWKATASHNTTTATDGLSLTTWSSGAQQEPAIWFQVELPKTTVLTEIQFDSPAQGGRGGGRGGRGGAAAGGTPAPVEPREYSVGVSSDGVTWNVVAKISAEAAATDVMFPPTQAKFLRVTQSAAGETARVWTIRSLRLFEPGQSSTP